MRSAVTAECNLPLIAVKPAVQSIGLPGGEAATNPVKTADYKLNAVWVSYPVAVLPGHLNAELLFSYRMATGATFNGGVVSFGGFYFRIGLPRLIRCLVSGAARLLLIP